MQLCKTRLADAVHDSLRVRVRTVREGLRGAWFLPRTLSCNPNCLSPEWYSPDEWVGAHSQTQADDSWQQHTRTPTAARPQPEPPCWYRPLVPTGRARATGRHRATSRRKRPGIEQPCHLPACLRCLLGSATLSPMDNTHNHLDEYAYDPPMFTVSRVNRRTGATIVVQFGDSGWETWCRTHDSVREYACKSHAMSWLSSPQDWCDGCAEVAR